MVASRRVFLVASVAMALPLLAACADAGPPRELGDMEGVDPEVPRPSPGSPLVTLQTGMGEITIALFEEQAPTTVENFLRYVEDGHYDGTIFHRVIEGFMIQGGGFEPGMEEKPTREPIINEAYNGLSNLRGTVAMARTRDPNSASAQFYINQVNNRQLDRGAGDAHGYAVFGVVVEGMDVVDSIAAVPVGTHQGRDVPRRDVVIQRAYRSGRVAPGEVGGR